MIKPILFIFSVILLTIFFLLFILPNKEKKNTSTPVYQINNLVTLPNQKLNWELTDFDNDKMRIQSTTDSFNTKQNIHSSFIYVETCQQNDTAIDYLDLKLNKVHSNKNSPFLPNCGFIKAKIPFLP